MSRLAEKASALCEACNDLGYTVSDTAVHPCDDCTKGAAMYYDDHGEWAKTLGLAATRDEYVAKCIAAGCVDNRGRA